MYQVRAQFPAKSNINNGINSILPFQNYLTLEHGIIFREMDGFAFW